MKPTPQLRWIERDDGKMPSVPIQQWHHIELYVLQQLWRDDDGKEEWRDVPIEHNP